MLFRRMAVVTAVAAVTLFAITCSAGPLAMRVMPDPIKEAKSYGGVTVVSGQVKDFLTGQPIQGAVVTAVNAVTNEVYKLSARTGPNGLYQLRLPSGQYVVNVQAGTGMHTSNFVEATGAYASVDLSPGDKMAPVWSFESPEVLVWRANSARVKFSGAVLDNHLLRDASFSINDDVIFSEANLFTSGREFSVEMDLAYGSHEIAGSAIDASDNFGAPKINFQLTQVPEPSTIVLVGISLLGGAVLLRKRG